MATNIASKNSVEDDSTYGANSANLRDTASLDYSNIGSDPFYHHTDDGGASSVTGGEGNFVYRHQDATAIVHEMHLALLYLLSNPEEFKKALKAHPPSGATTLDEWNAEMEDEDEESVMTSGVSTALPFIVFADDAEVVLPQAHTASQLFGIEKVEGIELEAAAGIPALSQLFLRWLALMPGGDHLNIIDPPGLTVMKIAGGRYRVTAAHRVVWTWMNEFASMTFDESVQDGSSPESESSLQVGDLVTLTVVDVFETDNQGKLLSYCPTFDNRDIRKTNQTAETLRKSSNKIFSMLGKAKKAVAKSEVNKKASEQISKMGLMQHAKNVAENVKHKVDEAVQQMNSPAKGSPARNNKQRNKEVMNSKKFEQAISAAEKDTGGDPQRKLYASAMSTDIEDDTQATEPEVERI
mmetsp:Transcript_17050/g.39344  ORF Transcript_17050/g.39344 Transcript_17050/m.39344 type:complete len:410 (-) Transcript_17050:54-1283(-)|eukprot:CAMPEP_0197189320 /NCGR_PEP_ID=MMETSP1423-20130617/19558_1 /TAXON_ID=476441 /ORGANISM="Pseudo-nitzschia heimii, Strain UNC1101" /LENGTH=409 /DNA_ID=CAMNT_0042641393 /DNA_START=72 /DNA_END=1301 /DNA_ORIENTATION=-